MGAEVGDAEVGSALVGAGDWGAEESVLAGAGGSELLEGGEGGAAWPVVAAGGAGEPSCSTGRDGPTTSIMTGADGVGRGPGRPVPPSAVGVGAATGAGGFAWAPSMTVVAGLTDGWSRSTMTNAALIIKVAPVISSTAVRALTSNVQIACTAGSSLCGPTARPCWAGVSAP